MEIRKFFACVWRAVWNMSVAEAGMLEYFEENE